MAKFLEQGDANRMLSNSIVDYKGRLTLIIAVVGRQFSGVDVETGEHIVDMADFDIIKNPNKGRLGYVNSKTGTTFFVRMASRITRMGLCTENVRAMSALSAAGKRVLTRLDGVLFPTFLKMYNNDYPTYEEAFESALDKGVPMAFDRSFAIDKNADLYYRGKRIGTANPRGEEFSDLTAAGRELLKVRHIPKLQWR